MISPESGLYSFLFFISEIGETTDCPLFAVRFVNLDTRRRRKAGATTSPERENFRRDRQDQQEHRACRKNE
jgi:hypothetical protein